MIYLVILLIFLLLVIIAIAGVYFLPPYLARKDIFLTTAPQGYILGKSNADPSADPDFYFSAPFDDGQQISRDGKLFYPEKVENIPDYQEEFLGLKGVFLLGLPPYAVLSQFPEITLKKVIITRSGDNTKYSLGEYNPCLQKGGRNIGFPRTLTLGIIVDNIEIRDGSQIDVFMTATFRVTNMKRLLAMALQDQFTQLSQEKIGGQVNDFFKRKEHGEPVFKTYSDIQEWAPNENTPSPNDLFERLDRLNKKLPGQEEGQGFDAILGVELIGTSINAVEGEDSINQMARQNAINIEKAKGDLVEAENQARITEITAKAEALATSIKGNAEAKVRAKKIKALASAGTEVARQQALSELKNLSTYVADSKNAHLAITDSSDKKNIDNEQKGGEK